MMNSQPAQPDEEIADRIKNGEKHLFESLMRKYNQRLYRIGMSILNDDPEVEDVMQTAYLNAYLHLSDFQHKSSFSTWLTRIFINECLLSQKRALRRKSLAEIPGEASSLTPLHNLMNTELKAILEKSISALPEKYRLIFMMREIEEMSVGETMEVLGLSESNVKVRLNRAKEMLRADLSGVYKAGVYDFHLSRCSKVIDGVMTQIRAMDFQDQFLSGEQVRG